jgi:hypothetical protein
LDDQVSPRQEPTQVVRGAGLPQVGQGDLRAALASVVKKWWPRGRASRDHFHRISFRLARTSSCHILSRHKLGGMLGYLFDARKADQMPEKWLNFLIVALLDLVRDMWTTE